MVIQATLCEIIINDKLLLQRKSTGRFGEGKWNAAGGKMKPSESPEACVKREVQEETGLLVGDLKYHGILDFYFGEKDEPDWIVHIFSTSKYDGKLKAGEEGVLKWFNLKEIPYAEMWEDDLHWLPKLLEGKMFSGYFIYDDKGEFILRHELTVE